MTFREITDFYRVTNTTNCMKICRIYLTLQVVNIRTNKLDNLNNLNLFIIHLNYLNESRGT
jgi:hypothetical protein